METMKAVVIRQACRAEDLQVSRVPVPKVKSGWVRVKIKAFGLNRAEIFTRNGLSPAVHWPRIIGIECVGVVDDASDSGLQAGQPVMSMMGGLGRDFDGSYAEYALIPAAQVYPVQSRLDWPLLAAVPEMYYTAYASLFQRLQLAAGETLLIRGGTSSVGLAALQLAKASGARVITTTRDAAKSAHLYALGADEVLADTGRLKPVRADKVLELVGAATLKDSLQTLGEGGICCMSGILGGWVLEHFEPMSDIPQGALLTGFDSTEIRPAVLAQMLAFIEQHGLQPPLAARFALDDIAAAHAQMESNRSNGKIVIVNPEGL
ncbi:MAG: zinc-binding dehydrogenase [Neisseria sp.]|nr:zinc-binding dehydrogenase [Neisseria sp.]